VLDRDAVDLDFKKASGGVGVGSAVCVVAVKVDLGRSDRDKAFDVVFFEASVISVIVADDDNVALSRIVAGDAVGEDTVCILSACV